jgi:hypothetical protein
MRFARAGGVVRLVAALSVMLSAGPAHALACAVVERADEPPVPSEAPCHPPSHEHAPPAQDVPAAPVESGDGGPSMSCCLAPAGVVRAVERPAQAPAAVLVPRLVAEVAAPARVDVRGGAVRPPAPPGPLHLLHGCFLT